MNSLAYALDGGDVGEAPVFVPPPRPIGEELDTIDDGRGFLGESFPFKGASISLTSLIHSS